MRCWILYFLVIFSVSGELMAVGGGDCTIGRFFQSACND